MTPKRICFYLFYFLVAFAGLALLNFPGKKIVKTLADEANRIGLTVTAPNIKRTFPLGVVCTQAEISMGSTTISVSPDLLGLNLPLSSLFLSSKTLGISGTWRQGSLNGSLKGELSPGTLPSLSVSLSQARFKKIPYHTDSFEISADFLLDGELDTETDNGRQRVKGRLVLSQVRCMMQRGLLKDTGTDIFGFSTIHIEFIHRGGETFGVTCKARGDWAAVDLDGIIQTGYMTDIADLSLDLKGYLRPAPEHAPAFAGLFPIVSLFDNSSARGIPIHITGTAGAPRLTR